VKVKIKKVKFPQQNNKKIIVGLSGGVDSATLAVLAKRHYGSISALYIDHGQKNSKIMEKAAIRISKDFSFPLDIQRISPSKDTATETELRKLRFEIYNRKVIAKRSILLLGHHAGDRVETFFINLLRGTRLKGLGSIPEKRGSIYRPLLEVPKNEILDYAKANKISYTEDTSNSNEEILRNWIRRRVIPLLSERSNRNLEETVESISKEIETMKKEGELHTEYFKIHKGYAEVPLALIENRTYKDQNLLINFLEKVKGEGVEKQNIENVYSTLTTGKDNVVFGNWRASISNGLLILIEPDLWPEEYIFDLDSVFHYWNNFSFKTNFNIEIFNNWNFIGDRNKIIGQIVIRRIKPSDTMQVDIGEQKVSELFRSAGISKSLRKVWPIFCDKEKIFWIPGVRTSRGVYLEDSSENILRIVGKATHKGES